MLSEPFKHFNKNGYPLIEFLTDISRSSGCLPEFIYVMDFDGMYEIHIGLFIHNGIDGNYYRVEEGGKPKYTLGDCIAFTSSRALRAATVHSVDILPRFKIKQLNRAYIPNIDLPRYRRWIEKYKPNRYK